MDTISMNREVRHVASAASIIAVWCVAAVLVTAAHQRLDHASVVGSMAAKLAVILLAAFAYMRVLARNVTLEHALFVGVAWALLSIITEMIAVTHFNPGWYPLLGSPSHAAFRNLLLAAWIGTPALFARRSS